MRLGIASALGALLLATAPVSARDSEVRQYAALAKAGGGVVKLDDRSYEDIVAGPRNYSVSIVLTALDPQFKCIPCRAFAPEYRLLAKQWARQPQAVRDSHFFAVLDFMDGRAVFQRLGLNSAPNVHLHLPTAGPRAPPSSDPGPVYYDFNRGGQAALKAEAFSYFVVSSAKISPFFRRPPNYAKLFAIGASALAFVAAAVFAWPFVSGAIGSRYLWACLTLPFILLMTSGHMWNEIRHPPYMMTTKEGQPSYFAGGFSNQYGVETQIIAGIYATLAFTAYTLTFTIAKLEDPGRQRAAVYIWGGVLLVVASLLVSVFRIKNGGYPFKLLF